MAEKFKVVKSIWFNHIGIVKVETKFYGSKYYIGEGIGLDEEEDEQKIARSGMPVSKAMLNEFFKED